MPSRSRSILMLLAVVLATAPLRAVWMPALLNAAHAACGHGDDHHGCHAHVSPVAGLAGAHWHHHHDHANAEHAHHGPCGGHHDPPAPGDSDHSHECLDDGCLCGVAVLWTAPRAVTAAPTPVVDGAERPRGALLTDAHPPQRALPPPARRIALVEQRALRITILQV